jgi:hypothetical protein
MISQKRSCWQNLTYPSSKSKIAVMNTILIFGSVSSFSSELDLRTHIEDGIDPAKGRLKGRCRKEISTSIPATVS